MTTNDHRPVLRGELVLVLAVIINSIGVLLMLHSGSGISAIARRSGNLCHFQRSLCLFRGVSGADPGHMDVYLSGTSCLCPYDTSPQIRSCLFVQLCCRFLLRQNDGYQ